MKKATLIFFTISLLAILSIVIFWNLPFEITRKSDIKLGNKLIENINLYESQNNTLPKNNDEKTLEKLGFKIEMLGIEPSYKSNLDGVYEIVFTEGFDGPYLMWNSNERKWKVGFPSIFKY